MPKGEAFVLDTHVWLDVAVGRERSFTARVRRSLERAAVAGALYVAAVTPWEVAMLARAGKVRVAGPLLGFVTESLRETRTAVAPLEPAIAVDAVELLRKKGFRAHRMEEGVVEWRARGWRVESEGAPQ